MKQGRSGMADDMANGRESTRDYLDATTAAMGERITNLNRRQGDFESETRNSLNALTNSVQSFMAETRTSFTTLSSTLSERNKPQWQAVGVALTFAALIGGLAYMPIREATTDLKTAVLSLSDRMVTHDELELRAARGTEDRLRTEATLATIRDDLVPRAEHSRVWASYDLQIANLRELIMSSNSEKQRQIEELKTALGGIYGARDALQEMRDRIDRLEMTRLRAPPVP